MVGVDGRPFFYLADTAWELFHRLTREERVGIFGHYRSLTLRMRGVGRGTRVWAQDLIGAEAEEITHAVRISEGAVELSGALIDRLGRACSGPGDRSEPGLVLHCQPPHGR